MSEFESIVSWDQAQSKGPVALSDWVCPLGDTQILLAVHRSSDLVTDAEIEILADGQWQHFEEFEYPEGFQTVKIVNSATGEVLTEPRYSQKYSGRTHGSGNIEVLLNNAIDLENGLIVDDVMNMDNGTRCKIRPAYIDPIHPEFLSRTRSSLTINPGDSKLMNIKLEGSVAAIQGAIGSVQVSESNGQRYAEMSLWVDDGRKITGQLDVRLDRDGYLQRLSVFGNGLLDATGLKDVRAPEDDWLEITDTDQQQHVMDGFNEKLGIGLWTGLDLRLTASGMYAAMKRPIIDPATALVSKK